MRNCTVRRSATACDCTVRAIFCQCATRTSTYMFEAIVSQAQFAICLREKMCGIDQCSSSAALGRATY